jgi:pyruvate carboxylase
VQILGDKQGDIYHLWERDCSVSAATRRSWSAPPPPTSRRSQREEVCELAVRLTRAVIYECAGTVEFLMDMDSGKLLLHRGEPPRSGRAYRDRGGHRHRHRPRPDPPRGRQSLAEATGVARQAGRACSLGHALQCRVTTEDPLNNFIPDYGRIQMYRSATGPASGSTAARPIRAR